MLYTITINQKAMIENDIDLSLQEYAIYECYRKLLASNNDKLITTIYENKRYVLFSHKLIIDQLPMLKIGTQQGIKKRLVKLIEQNILEPHPDNMSLRMAYYTLGSKADLLEFEESNKSYKPTTKVSRPTTKVVSTYNKSCKDNIISNKEISNKNNINVENSENSSTPKKFKKLNSYTSFDQLPKKLQSFLNHFILEMNKYSEFKMRATSKGNFGPILDLLNSQYKGIEKDFNGEENTERLKNLWIDCMNALKGQVHSYKFNEAENKRHVKPSVLFQLKKFEKYLTIGEEMKPTPTSENNNRSLTSDEINRLQALGSI